LKIKKIESKKVATLYFRKALEKKSLPLKREDRRDLNKSMVTHDKKKYPA